MATTDRRYLSPGQRTGLHMISRGHRPHRASLEALFNKGLVTGSLATPTLNDAGAYFVVHGELPPERWS